jgi:protein TonB
MRFAFSAGRDIPGPSPYLAPPRPSVLWFVFVAATHVGALTWLYSAGRITAPATPTALMVRIIAPVQKVVTTPVAAVPAPLVSRPPPATPVRQPRIRRPVASPSPPAPVMPTQTLATQNETADSSAASSLPAREALPAPAQAAEPAAAPAAPLVTQARFDADYLQNPAPIYPALSRRMGEEGKVVLRVFVSPDGLPEKMEVRTGSGSSRLDKAAQDAVRRWKFVPARRGDEAVGAWVQVPIVFKLRD